MNSKPEKYTIPLSILKDLGLPMDIINMIDMYANKEKETELYIYQRLEYLYSMIVPCVINASLINKDAALLIIYNNYLQCFGSSFREFLTRNPKAAEKIIEDQQKEQRCYSNIVQVNQTCDFFDIIFKDIFRTMFDYGKTRDYNDLTAETLIIILDKLGYDEGFLTENGDLIITD